MEIRLIAALTLAASTTLSAHDFWLASPAPAPAGAGARTTVTANVGEVFPKGTNFTQPERVDQWRVIGVGGEIPVTRDFRREGDSLAADVTLPAQGVYLGVMTIGARTIEMKGDEFTDYLKEEGLTQVIAARQAAGEAGKTVTERYARYAKIALRSGQGSGAHLTGPTGLKAEFIPSGDPTAMRVGESLDVLLIADMKPVSDAEVTAVNAAGGTPIKARTDKNGRVSLTLDRPGSWLVKTVHMTRVAGTPGVDWESYWVTLAFQTAGGASASADPVAAEFAKLQGTWTVTAAEQNGKPLDVIKGGMLTIADRSFALKTAAGNEFKGELRLNPTTTPKQVDYVHAGGALVWEGIYTAEGDVFRVNYVEAGGRDKRPTLFATAADSPGLVIVMRRAPK